MKCIDLPGTSSFPNVPRPSPSVELSANDLSCWGEVNGKRCRKELFLFSDHSRVRAKRQTKTEILATRGSSKTWVRALPVPQLRLTTWRRSFPPIFPRSFGPRATSIERFLIPRTLSSNRLQSVHRHRHREYPVTMATNSMSIFALITSWIKGKSRKPSKMKKKINKMLRGSQLKNFSRCSRSNRLKKRTKLSLSPFFNSIKHFKKRLEKCYALGKNILKHIQTYIDPYKVILFTCLCTITSSLSLLLTWVATSTASFLISSLSLSSLVRFIRSLRLSISSSWRCCSFFTSHSTLLLILS